MPKLPYGDIGPCEVTWDYGGTPVIITPYLGKVKLRMTDTVTDVHKEGEGAAAIDAYFGGSTMELEIPMARSTLVQLAQTIGYGAMGTLSPAGTVLTLHNVAGFDLYTLAKQIVIKPICNNVPDTNMRHWVTLFKCHPYRDYELGFDRDGERIHMVKFKVFPNQDTGYEGDFYTEGTAGYQEDFYDDFCGPALGPEWTTHGLDANKLITLDPTPPCWALISVINNVNALWWCSVPANNLCPKMYMPLGAIGPCRITTKLRSYTVNDDTMAGIFIGTNPTGVGPIGTNYAYLWGRHRDDSAGLDYRFRIQTNCSSEKTDEPLTGPYAPMWLQIRVDAAQVITFWFSKDGTTYTRYTERGEGGGGAAYEVSGYDIPNCYVGLFAKNINEVVLTNIAAPFEFFMIESHG